MAYTYKGYEIYKSDKKDKKYYAVVGNKKVYFGAIKPDGTPYEQFHDKIGLYKKYDHKDKARRDRYYARHKKDYPKASSDWFSKKILW